MPPTNQTFRICPQGHRYFKSTDCPSCPICEESRKPKDQFLSVLSAPARRALESEKIFTTEQLSNYSEQDLLKLHGFGPGSLPKLRKLLFDKGLQFKS
ncbi:MAG: hypothetical protein IPM48_07765 [Saprospiraceae bacterium]|nr:hypothetical protein [Saprospiraceae bacterium]